jgi:hypothetical protein
MKKITPELKKYIVANVLGNGLEWYDFVIFGYFSPVFALQFFPTFSRSASLINIFAMIAVGFLGPP